MRRFFVSLLVFVFAFVVAAAAAFAQTKPLTNDDLVKMFKSGLPESTIVLAIEKGPCEFDTSAPALIALKEQGATPRILDAVVQCKSALPKMETVATRKNEVARPDTIGVVYFVTSEGSLVRLEHMRAKTTAGGFWKTKVAAEIKEQKSELRLPKQPQMTFLIRVASGIDPSKYELYAFRVAGGHREVVMAKGGWFKMQLQPGSLPFEITHVTESVYRFTPKGELPPGEYGFSPSDSNDAYCFGVDPG